MKQSKKKIKIKDLVNEKKYTSSIVYSAGIENIIDVVCKETNLSRLEVKKIIDAQFRMLKLIMNKEGLITPDSNFEDFMSIRLMRLGSFKPSQKKFERIKEFVNNEEKKK